MTNPWTPGPWPIEYDNDTGHDDSGFSAWYLVGPARVDIGFGQTKIAAANARLISAAPEMAEVLERLVVMLDRQERPGGLSDTRVVEARALLARIRGDAT
jgi:hypothetical protein